MSEQQLDLIAHEGNVVEPARPPEWLNIVARKKLGVGEDWRWCKWEVVGDDLIVEGGVPRELKSGSRKGMPTWRDSALTRLIVSKVEIEQAKAAYEAESGNCFECAGSSLEWAGWSAEAGNRYRQCRRCSGARSSVLVA